MRPAPILEQEFLPLRAKLLEIAAALDRLDQAGVDGRGDVRLTRIHDAIEKLRSTDGDRAAQIQLVFSRPYESDWRKKFGLAE